MQHQIQDVIPKKFAHLKNISYVEIKSYTSSEPPVTFLIPILQGKELNLSF